MVDLLNIDKRLLIPYIFTSRQYDILAKRQQGKPLTNTERVYYSRTIAKKLKAVDAMAGIETNYHIYGKEFMLPDRIGTALELLKKLSRKHRNKKLLITGSFLYKSKFKDIDVFIITKNDKEDKMQGKIQLNYLPENVEGTLFFASISRLCVSNFPISTRKHIRRITLDDYVRNYELLLLLMLSKQDYKPELRDFIVKSFYLNQNIFINSRQLHEKTDELCKNKLRIQIFSKILVETLINTFNNKALVPKLKKFIKLNEETRSETKVHDNLDIGNAAFREVISIVAS